MRSAVGGGSIFVLDLECKLTEVVENVSKPMESTEDIKKQALARVRDEIWKMRTSDDLENVLKAMWDGLGALAVPLMYCSVNLVDEGADPPVAVYSLNQQGRWRRREYAPAADAALMNIMRERKIAYRADLEREDPYGEWDQFSAIPIHSIVDVPFEQGTLAMSSKVPDAFTNEHLDILQDMADILADGFRRLQDLQDLEHRNRELEREIAERERREQQKAARYRVREQVWKMDSVDDIDSVLEAVGDTLRTLEVPFMFCGVNIIDTTSQSPAAVYSMNLQGIWTKRDIPGTPTILELWRQGEVVYRRDLRREDPYGEGARFSTMRSIVDVPFSHGTLAVSSREPEAFSDEDLDILRDMARILSEGFRRMEDLQVLRQRNQDLEREMTERRRAETDLYQAKEAAEAANRAKSAFLANMSHELRTPLNAILGFTQLMGRDSTLSAAQRDNLDIVSHSGEHLLNLINDVLEMSRIEAGRTELRTEAFDLYGLLDSQEEMFRLRAEAKNLQLACERAEDVPRYVRADPSKLRQVLINLVGNAIKFTARGGVVLRTRCEREKQSLRLHFEVEDTGPGIAPEEQETLFEAFVQTATSQQFREGTGLGLPISQQFARLMGGDLVLRSEIGKGSVFAFDIEVEPAAASDIAAPQTARKVIGLEADQPTYRILVVEDQLENRKLLVKLLESVGFAVREATDGERAVAVWEEWSPHLIWMDMRMPVMDGYEATRLIKTAAAGKPPLIIALTASAFEENRETVLAAGCDDFVRKPFRQEDIFESMTLHLGVSFTYGDAAAALPPDAAPALLSPEALADLPASWRSELHQAASMADDEAIGALLDQIEAERADVAGALAELVRDFRFDEIMDLTRNAAKEPHV